jgi:hypothetical protein
VSSDKLRAGVEEHEGVVESACKVLGDDGAEEDAELVGEIIVLNPPLAFDFDGNFGYDV